MLMNLAVGHPLLTSGRTGTGKRSNIAPLLSSLVQPTVLISTSSQTSLTF